ncbi:MAG: peptidoglycan DD-metalloendopeptidase family protein, partial [Pseudomonadota bacterium]
AYNGLPPNHVLKSGDELVLPPKPGGYTATATAPAPAPVPAPAPSPQSPAIESAPLDLGGGTAVAQAPAVTAPETAASGTGAEWSPELAEAAIQRATGLQPDGTLAAPPSANEPVPEAPADPPALESPDLSQYQTPRPVPAPEAEVPAPPEQTAPVAAPIPTATPDVAEAASEAVPAAPEVVPSTEPAPAPAQTARLQRPVDGPVALGFQRGSGSSRNDGIDFATAPGAPVVAADDGEVALVSQSLGGLGTIVLLRHQGDLLTVYGRITDVTLKKGELVRRGQQIGSVATPPSGSEARMHFEVRRGAESLDPRRFIAG